MVKPKPSAPDSKKSNKATSKSTDKKVVSNTLLAGNHFSHQRKKNKTKTKPITTKNIPSKGISFFQKCKLSGLKLLKKIKSYLSNRRQKKKRKKATQNQSLAPDSFQVKQPFHKRLIRYIFSLKAVFLVVKIGLILLIISAVGLSILYLNYRQEIPKNIANLDICIEGQTTQYYDQTGQVLLWSSKSDVDCQPVQSSDVSQYLIDALITMEDQEFYDHYGFQPTAIIRAFWHNLTQEDKIQGGSTITQQYIKNAILQDRSRNFDRKIKELIIAVEVERTFTKEEILTAYLNTVSFGSIYSGVEAASQGYFNKSAQDLSLDEAALLVAALPAPTTYWNDQALHQDRQQLVLKTMLGNNVITQDEYDQATAIDTFAKVKSTHRQYENIIAPHFILEAEKRLTQHFCDQNDNQTEPECQNIRLQGYKVITTLDIEAQKLAQQSVDDIIPAIEDRNFDNAASVAVDVDTGKVIALVGSRNFDHPDYGQNNIVTEQRDPGSTFKLFDYAALIENTPDWGPGSILYDYETTFNNQGWTPTNYSERFSGPITMRRALGQSLNIPAVKAMYIAGMNTVHDLAYDAGIRTPLPCHVDPNDDNICGLATAFGGGAEVRLDELTNAYATFGRNGIYLPLTYIDRIEDSEGNILFNWQQQPERVVQAETAYLLNDMLSDASVRYTQAFNLDPALQATMAIKTGTDDDFVNNHIVGYTKSVAFGTWIGHHDESVLHETERNTSPVKAQMVKTFMEPYHRNLPHEYRSHWSKPRGIKEVSIDLITGYQVDSSSNNTRLTTQQTTLPVNFKTDIFPAWYNPKRPTIDDNEVISIDIVSGKRATDCTPPRAIYRGTTVNILAELPSDDPFYYNWYSPVVENLQAQYNIVASSGGMDELHQCNDQKPQLTLIDKPQNCANSCRLTFEATAGDFDLKQLIISHNNQILDDGLIELDNQEKRQIITYDYKPLTVNSEPQFRGSLKVELVDQALYDDSLDVLLNIAGFPEPQLPVNELILLTATIDEDRQNLNLSWNYASYDINIIFDGDCLDLQPIIAPSNETSLSIQINHLFEGDCLVYLQYDGDKKSNTLEFEIMTEDDIVDDVDISEL